MHGHLSELGNREEQLYDNKHGNKNFESQQTQTHYQTESTSSILRNHILHDTIKSKHIVRLQTP